MGVVFCHVHAWEYAYLHEHAVTPSFFDEGGKGVSLFFLISGFIMVFIEPQPIQTFSNYLRFFIHRFSRIYPPLWLVLVPLTGLWLVRPELFNRIYDNQVDIVRSYLLLPQDYGPLIGQSWTLIHEVYFYIVVSIPLLLGVRGRWLVGSLWFLTVLIVFTTFGQTHFNENRFLQIAFSPYSLTFLLGYFIGLSHGQIKKIPWQAALAILGMGVALYFSMSSWFPQPTGEDTYYPNNNFLNTFLHSGIPFAYIVVAALALERYVPKILWPLERLGDASYALYLTHVTIVAGFYRGVQFLKIYNSTFLIFTAMVCIATCLLVSWFFHLYLEKPVTRACRLFLEKQFGITGRDRPQTVSLADEPISSSNTIS